MVWLYGIGVGVVVGVVVGVGLYCRRGTNDLCYRPPA